MAMKVKEVAELAGISVRTLHHYDAIGLLVPDEVTEAGYRLYSERNLELLQQILFFKALDFPLKQIKEIVSHPSFDRQEALQLHRSILLEKRNRLDRMLAVIDKTMKQAKGELEMTQEEKFAGFDFSRSPYEQEARRRWGDEAVERSKAKLGSLTKEEQSRLSEGAGEIFTRLAALRGGAPDAPEAQAAIHEWYLFISKFGVYPPEAVRGLGQMYVDDVRFTQNIDKHGEGLAAFMRDAMAVYAGRMQP
ncbi:MerR family transcriptional regulator [Paenibacillus protaetiae]|uniref:MerR family transcriptional regulator n=1 Tax=Paenibacillus protaetiae TaxID=2509456 RepID=A0A4V0YFG3_9BACL|nr:MerR family transcriptional regulator [Paenibacillus protaetiae]QAY67611.1 MerR family transcriptional regulator [Paenibacillus protaetiae]